MSSERSLFGQERWTATELAEALCLSVQRINMLVKEGVLPAAIDGRYLPRDAISAYVRHLRRREAGSSRAGELERKTKLENQIRTIKLQRLAGELVQVDRVKADWFRVARHVRDGLLNLPNRLAGPFAAESNQQKIFSILTAEINQALLDLSSYRGDYEHNKPMEVMGPDQGSGTGEGSKDALLSGGHEDDSLGLQHERDPAGGGEDGLKSDSNEFSQRN